MTVALYRECCGGGNKNAREEPSAGPGTWRGSEQHSAGTLAPAALLPRVGGAGGRGRAGSRRAPRTRLARRGRATSRPPTRAKNGIFNLVLTRSVQHAPKPLPFYVLKRGICEFT